MNHFFAKLSGQDSLRFFCILRRQHLAKGWQDFSEVAEKYHKTPTVKQKELTKLALPKHQGF